MIADPFGRPASRLPRLSIVAVALGSTMAGCMPAAATSQGREIGGLYLVFLAGGIVVAAIVWSLATLAVFRFRRRDGRVPRQTTGSIRIEAVWTAIPLITVLVLFGLTLRTLSVVDTSDASDVDLRVTAFRWQWQATYPATGVTLVGAPAAPLEVVLPVGPTIHVTVESVDVNHAFYVPAFLFKRDAIPGRPTSFDLQIEQPGLYPGQCAEFCGVFHARMTFTVRAVSPDEFERWLTAQQGGGTP